MLLEPVPNQEKPRCRGVGSDCECARRVSRRPCQARSLAVQKLVGPVKVEIVEQHVGDLLRMRPSAVATTKQEITRLRVFLMSKAGCGLHNLPQFRALE